MTVQPDPMFSRNPPTATPYAGTTGYMPVGTSRDAAEQAVASGAANARQANILGMLREAGEFGLTSAEIETRTGLGHGPVSGALSSMHKVGLIVALKFVRRNGCGVYVLPDQVAGRIVRPFVSLAESRADRPAKASPAPARSRLTTEELELASKIRVALKGYNDKPIIQMRPATVRSLLDALDRLNA